MKLEERVAETTNDKKLKNDLIGEYQNFILAAASKVLKRSVMTSDDEYIIAMMASVTRLTTIMKIKVIFSALQRLLYGTELLTV